MYAYQTNAFKRTEIMLHYIKFKYQIFVRKCEMNKNEHDKLRKRHIYVSGLICSIFKGLRYFIWNEIITPSENET